MLSERYLSYDQVGDDALVPRWLGPRDAPWLRELVLELRAADGMAAGEAEQRILETVAARATAHGIAPRRTVEAVWIVERRRWSTRVVAPMEPAKLRRIVFDRAAEIGRGAALAVLSQELALDEAAILEGLFADRDDARRLVAPAEPATESLLAERYNLALAQGFLIRSTEVIATVRGHARSVARQASLLRLMVDVREDADGATCMAISGPLALFHDTVKYGRALAQWLPSLLATPEWELRCRVSVRGEPKTVTLDPTAPLAAVQKLPVEFDSKLEARLDRDLRRLRLPWRIERESAVVRAGRHLFFPDFTLVDEGGRRVAVEVAGYWTPEYLAAKQRLVDAVEMPFVICVDSRHGDAIVAPSDNRLAFDGKIDVQALVATCKRALDAPRRRAWARHWLTIPKTAQLAAWAVRLGASEQHWREEIIADLAARGSLVVGLERSDAAHRTRALLCGERFHVEFVRDGTRLDALFAHRIVAARPLAWRRPLHARLELRAPGEKAPAADDVTPTILEIRDLAVAAAQAARKIPSSIAASWASHARTNGSSAR